MRQFKRRAAQLQRRKDKKAKKAQGTPIAPSTRTYKPEEKVKVLVAILSLDGNVHWTIAHQFGRMIGNSVNPTCPFQFITHVRAGTRPVEYTRNQITDLFMHETDAQILYMIDNDQVMPDNWWELLGVGGADIVSATTYCWVGTDYVPGRLRVNQYAIDEKAECFNIAPPATKGQPYQVNIVGTGCIAIRRYVFEKLGCARENCKEHKKVDERPPWYFTEHWDGRHRGSEDINFCVNAHKAGFKIAVHPGVVFGHVKPIDLAQVDQTMRGVLKMKEDGKQHSIEDMKSLG